MVWIAKGVPVFIFGNMIWRLRSNSSDIFARTAYLTPLAPFLPGHELPLNPLLLFTGTDVGTCVRNDKTLICSRAEKQIEGSLCYVTAICQTVFPVVAFMQLR